MNELSNNEKGPAMTGSSAEIFGAGFAILATLDRFPPQRDSPANETRETSGLRGMEEGI